MMAIFISRISRGRTIRELIIAVSIVAPLVSNFWFAVVGGTGIFLEKETPGSVSTFLAESGMPAAVMAIMDQLPRSEEHTSELQSRGHLVCRLLLEKKKTT